MKLSSDASHSLNSEHDKLGHRKDGNDDIDSGRHK